MNLAAVSDPRPAVGAREGMTDMGVAISNKELSVARINFDGSLNVILSLAAEPEIVNNPTDMVLVLDRSGSMAGAPLESLKLGARTFIDSSTRPPCAPR